MIVWAIGGLDPTGGAGLLRDAWTAARIAPEVELRCVATALTRQGHGRPAEVFAVEADRVARCLERLPSPRAIKLGLMPASVAEVVARALEKQHVPIVVDPVMVASDGGDLGTALASQLRLAARASVLTPNPAEARALSPASEPPSPQALRSHVGARALLLKSVAPSHPDAVRDLLVDDEGELVFERRRVDGPDPRGTGCALATAIACLLARGAGTRQAVADAITWLDRARAHTRTGLDGRAHLA